MTEPASTIEVRGASEHNLKGIDVSIDRAAITVITGVSGSGKSSLAFDTVLAEAQRRFFYTLSHYSRQFLDLTARPAARSISGLSPAIALAQNETLPSRRATVGTLTDMSELLGVLFARFGAQLCPEHQLPTSALTTAEVAAQLLSSRDGETLAICAPVAEAKKGSFKSQLSGCADRGYLRVMIDGSVTSLSPLPVLAKEEKHTIKLIVDYVKVRPASAARLERSLGTALTEGQGFGEYFCSDAKGHLDLASRAGFSAKGGCPRCGFSWPRLDSRHFSANSLGRCASCDGLGEVCEEPVALQANAPKTAKAPAAAAKGEATAEASAFAEAQCRSCSGSGLSAHLGGIKLSGATPQTWLTVPLTEVSLLLEQLLDQYATLVALRRVAEELQSTLQRLVDIGLGYLTLARRVRSLSGGEAQRLRLAGILAENLRGVLYVLDEPSQGLHPTEIVQLVVALRRLKSAGNTVLIVDHDEMLMRAADWIIDLGPGGGARGGRLMAKFRPGDAALFAGQSVTAKHLASISVPAIAAPAPKPTSAADLGQPVRPMLKLLGARLHNLNIERVAFPLAAFTVVTGVSGAGKSSLVLGTLLPNAVAAAADNEQRHGRKSPAASPLHVRALEGFASLTSVVLVDRRPIAKSSVSMPVSYLDVLGELRELYAAQSDAQVMGLTARSFSLSVDAGRCPECKGRGVLSLSMRFLADARVRCPLCKGLRYQSTVLAVRYLGLSINDVLELTLDEALEHFKHHRKIVQRLAPAVELGLGYLKLGQPSSSLSGGESQRLKLVPLLATRRGDGVGGGQHNQGHLIILDEPTTGLHFEDVERLLKVLRQLVASGATIVTIEHHSAVIAAADWLIELGPGAAKFGGKLTYQGEPR